MMTWSPLTEEVSSLLNTSLNRSLNRRKQSRTYRIQETESSAMMRSFIVLVALLSSSFTNNSRRKGSVTAFSTPTSNPNKSIPISLESLAVLGVGDLRINDRPMEYDAIAILLTDDNIRAMPSAKTHTLDTVKLLHAAYLDIEKGTSKNQFYFCENVATLPTAENYQVCDLGLVDNMLGYGAYAAFQHARQTADLRLWDDFLRDEPWRNVHQFQGANYPDYERNFLQQINVKPPLGKNKENSEDSFNNVGVSAVPSFDDLLDRFVRVLGLHADTVQAAANTGLFATHWGGLDHSSVVESAILSKVDMVRTEELMKATANEKSLEHKSIQWQQKTSWMIEDESSLRFLTAPLLLGTVSSRRLLSRFVSSSRQSGLAKFIEAREWHKLLAAATIEQELTHGAKFKYWRWHGFLCRYVESSANAESSDAPSLVLVHGFGASATQWLDVMQESSSFTSCFAPDQLGFGHAEKPGLSFTAYLWDSMLTDFCKEIVPNEYVAAGNSIGGFTSLSLAASDSATAEQWSSNGAPGAGQCAGLVLCNSAGNIISKAEANALVERGRALPSIAKLTASGELPPCRPPPRLVARAFGNFLLSQLRPRIQGICKNLYPVNPDAVDTELCAEIARDSLDPGAIHVMMSGSKLPPPRTANELLNADFANGNAREESTFDGPVLIAQGILDPLNAAEDRMQMYGALRKGITTHALQAGHCPHDEVPSEVASAVSKWIRISVQQSTRTPIASKR